MLVRNLADSEPFTTVDGSAIREVAGQVSLPAVNQSLAQATIPVGGATTAHLHPIAEELYFITRGTGLMRLAGEERAVGPGDCIVIPPGAEHKLRNTGAEPLELLCCCAPAYRHEDTVLTEPEVGRAPQPEAI
jgi:mannose-6-phosphate isomerase-like protein (cupin superfamily)